MIVSVYGIKYTESIKQIRHTTSEPLLCGPATTYLKNLTVHCQNARLLGFKGQRARLQYADFKAIKGGSLGLLVPHTQQSHSLVPN